MYQFNIEHKQNWIDGASVAAEAIKFGRPLIKEGASVLEVTEKIEAKIKELGGELAFPVNISRNTEAAHYTAKFNDKLVFGKDLVKLDIGAHKDGFLGDCAVTIDLTGKHQKFVETAKFARETAVKLCIPGTTLGKIGRAVEEVAHQNGLKVIRNLSGHGVAQYNAHVSPTIPNYDTGDNTKLEYGMVIAIEPFVTDGIGLIKDSGDYEIFNLVEFKQLRMPFARNILKYITERYRLLPFSRRELLVAGFSDAHIRMTLQQLEQLGCLEKHAPLIEKGNGMIAQSEVTVFVSNEPVILTPIDE